MTAAAKHEMVLTTPSDREITLTRAFNAPRELVFKALTTPDLIRRWWGAGHAEMTACHFDARVGGTWRFEAKTPDGYELAFFGEVREFDPPAGLVYTEAFDIPEARDRPSIVTVRLREENGVTTLTTTSLFASAEDRDMVIGSGMEHGAAASYDALEAVLAEQ
jgi:uncharacterized protein YndB with AHSA1/START domain